jgi:hypothetical protein
METAKSEKIILSSAYLPSIEYMFHLVKSTAIYIEGFETYQKQTWRNRCTINTANGALDLIIPVKKPNGNNTKTNEVIIDNSSKWQINHWRAIESAYQKSPYYIYYVDLFKQFYCSSFIGLLINWNSELLQSILKEFKFKKEILYTKDFVPEYSDANDLRFELKPKKAERQFEITFPEYIQVFGEKHGFKPNMSIIDLVFNLGPDLPMYLNEIKH